MSTVHGPHRVLLLGLLLAACKGVEPAPTELDDLFHYTWDQWEGGEDAALAEAVANFHAAIDGDAITDAIDGTISDMSPEQLEAVGRSDADPADAQGMYIARSFACDLDTLTEVLTAPNQDELYEGAYEAYERAYDADQSAFVDGSTDLLEWDLSYDVSVLGINYSANSRGGLRRVADAELMPGSPALFARTYMKEPATFGNEDSDKVQDQDFQVEIFWPRGDEEIVHVYAMWRYADFGSGIATDNESYQRIMLNNMASWDDDTEKLCAEGW